MADLNLECATPGCGRPLTAIPSMCPECGTFWGSAGQLGQAHKPVRPPMAPVLVAPGDTACIGVGTNLVAIPDNTEIVLGRESEWDQIVGLFDGQAEEARFGVSRRHASLTVLGGKARIVDLGSTNGTWVGGRDISASPVVRMLPASFVLGLPDMGLVVQVRTILRGEPVSEWTGVRRV